MSCLGTGSELDRLMLCPASAALPRAREATGAQRAGTALAQFLAALDTMSRDQALAAAPAEHREFLSRVDVEMIRPVRGWLGEVAFVYDVETDESRELGRKLERGYERALKRPAKPTEIFLTADAVSVAADTAYILDDKRGWAPHVPPARECWQVLAGGLAAARAYGCDRAVVGIGRVLDDGVPRFDSAELDEMALDIVAAQLRDLYRKIEAARKKVAAGETPTVTIGDHCRYCPALVYCPAHRALVGSVVRNQPTHTSLRAVVDAKPEEIDDDTAAFAWRDLVAAQKFLGKVRESLIARAYHRPFARCDGLWMIARDKPGRPEYDGRKVHHILESRLGREVADSAVHWTTSGAAIDRAVRNVPHEQGGALSGEWTAWRRDLQDELEAQGAVHRGEPRLEVNAKGVKLKPEEVEQVLGGQTALEHEELSDTEGGEND